MRSLKAMYISHGINISQNAGQIYVNEVSEKSETLKYWQQRDRLETSMRHEI